MGDEPKPSDPTVREGESARRWGSLSSDFDNDPLATRKQEGTAASPLRSVPSGAAPDSERYCLVEELGRGGMGVVYRAHDRTLGRDVALKVLQLGARVDDEAIERFQREARAAAALEHPNIIRVHDIGRLGASFAGGHEGRPYYTMELLHGRDLAHAIADGGIAPRAAVEAVRQVSLALLYAHQRGVLHRDLKPQNVFLQQDRTRVPEAGAPTVPSGAPTPGGEVHALLLDFGLAKLAENDLSAHAEGSKGRKSMQSLTRSGEIFGTPAYMPPEQTRGAKDVDNRADIYSLGATLYHALSGKPPFEAGSLAELLDKVQKEDPSPPSLHDRGLDADLDTVCLKCLQKDPNDRYQNAGELAEELRRWLAGEAISARPIGLAGRLWRRAKRNKPVAISLAVSLAAVLGTGAWFGVDAATRAWKLSRHQADYDVAMAQRRFDDAAGSAERGRDLAPKDALWRERKEAALYERSAVLGRAQLAAWQRCRDESADLERAAKPQSSAPSLSGEQGLTEAERDTRRDQRWKAEEDLAAHVLAREEAWSKATVAFTEAITHRSTREAEEALTELYWDHYLRAERDRDRAAMRVDESYVVHFGKEKYEHELRGQREVSVRFWLPAAYAGGEVVAYLSEYRPCERPPVLVPVPYDLAHGRPVQDFVERLAQDDAEWKPVPISEAREMGPKRRGRSLFDARFIDEGRVRLVVAREGDRPFVDFKARLLRGSYLLCFAPAQGLIALRYPFEVTREFPWEERCELPADSDLPPIPPGTTPPGERPYWVYVPAGPYRASGDPGAQQNPPRDAAVLRVPEERPLSEIGAPLALQGCYAARFEVTGPMYLAYLNDREWHKQCNPPCGEWGHVPRKMPDAMQQTSHWPRDSTSGLFSIPPMWEGWPIIAVSWTDATDYCRWLTSKIGGDRWQFLLPSEDEWEKTARGPDGRYFPWGDSFDDTFCAMVDSRSGGREKWNPEPYGLYPIDESPYGVRDMAGSVVQWTRTEWGALRIEKGGSWGGQRAFCHSASRLGNTTAIVSGAYGFRVFAHRIP